MHIGKHKIMPFASLLVLFDLVVYSVMYNASTPFYLYPHLRLCSPGSADRWSFTSLLCIAFDSPLSHCSFTVSEITFNSA